MARISIIVPVYKVEQYLNFCIESIVNQTYKDLEIILVDDGSPDRCPLICDEWAVMDARIRVIHKENGGLSDARNAGMAISTGDYIGFVDSDDWLDFDYYEKLIKAIEDNNAEIAASDVVWEYGDHQEFNKRYNQTLFLTEEALDTILCGNGFHATAWNKLYRADIIKEFSYPLGRLHEDEFVTYRAVAKASRLALCQETKYHYRQREGSIMNSVSEKHLDALDAYLQRLNFLKEYYPRLYIKDKPIFCILLAEYYQKTMHKTDSVISLRIQKKLQRMRREVHYSFSDLKRYSLKQRLYIFGTGLNLKLFCKILMLRDKNERFKN